MDMKKHLPVRFSERGTVPKLIPAGSVNRVLLVGGRNLTLFQSVGLIVMGLLFAVGFGTVAWSLARGGDWSGSSFLLFVTGAMGLWGGVMSVNGMIGVARHVSSTKRHES
jgi:hypothetical protein